ncbi:MAG TPA: BMP family ABC transporter substrate-binding protein, partial [Patescibacteria group bacterium]|nr:BMP family ABC transporter substrate-binding protein [Patescibacteria group bacterium]
MKKIVSLLLVLVLALTVVLTGCGPKAAPAAAAPGEATKEEPLKVGFIYVGSAKDGGYSQAHDEGRL